MVNGRTVKGKHHASVHDLRIAAISNCQICASVYESYQKQGGIGYTFDAQDDFLKYDFDWEDPFPVSDEAAETWNNGVFELDNAVLHYLEIRTTSLGPWNGHDVFIFPSKNQGSRSLPLPSSQESLYNFLVNVDYEPWRVVEDEFKKNTPSHTGHPDVTRIARNWLRTCQEEHHSCGTGIRDSPLLWWPKRVIDLTGSRPKLLLTEGERPRGGYAALSHCWGKAPNLFTLTADNIAKLQDRAVSDPCTAAMMFLLTGS